MIRNSDCLIGQNVGEVILSSAFNFDMQDQSGYCIDAPRCMAAGSTVRVAISEPFIATRIAPRD
jgi:hypothetical protein